MNNNLISRAKTISQQIEELLRERIQQGIYPPEKRMPSEDNLARELNVSRASVRTAMASLVAKGCVQRRQGDGTYPSSHIFELGLRVEKMWDIMRQIWESGRNAEQKTLEQGLRSANEEEMKLLKLTSDEQVLALRRLFLADGKPVALISSTIRTEGLSDRLPEDAAALSPLSFLARCHGQKPGLSTAYFNAVPADAEMAGLLQIEMGSPLLKMSGVVFDQANCPLMVETEIYLGDEGFQMQAKTIQN